jgi:hypothetical protein
LSEASGAFRAAADPLSGGAAKPTQPIPPLGLTLGNLGEGAIAAEPDVVDPSPGLGDGGEQSVPAFRPHRPFGAGRIYSVQGAFTETNSVRLCGREMDGKWSDVATRR